MWPDGICRVTDTRYTKTIQYQDINYQLSQNEDKTAIFEAWCDFLNYFDSSVQFQLSFVNLSASQETFARSISIPPCGDEFDGIRAEYAGMLQNQLARGNNGLIKTKYLTFGIEADNLRAAKPRLERIETDLLNNFKRLGVVAAPLNGFERLHVMHDILRLRCQNLHEADRTQLFAHTKLPAGLELKGAGRDKVLGGQPGGSQPVHFHSALRGRV